MIYRIIEGQGTVGCGNSGRSYQTLIIYLFRLVVVDLAAGVGSYFKTYSPKTKIIGVEPEGAPSMYEALKAGHPVTLKILNGLLMVLQ